MYQHSNPSIFITRMHYKILRRGKVPLEVRREGDISRVKEMYVRVTSGMHANSMIIAANTSTDEEKIEEEA